MVNLFYITELSHSEIGAFLGTPVQTVKNRLHASRKRLKNKEWIDMAKERLPHQRPSRNKDFVTRIMDELVDLSDRRIQRILREVDQRDCIAALKGASIRNPRENPRQYVEAGAQLHRRTDGGTERDRRS